MPWQLCSASVKPAGIIQVFLEKSTTMPLKSQIKNELADQDQEKKAKKFQGSYKKNTV